MKNHMVIMRWWPRFYNEPNWTRWPRYEVKTAALSGRQTSEMRELDHLRTIIKAAGSEIASTTLTSGCRSSLLRLWMNASADDLRRNPNPTWLSWWSEKTGSWYFGKDERSMLTRVCRTSPPSNTCFRSHLSNWTVIWRPILLYGYESVIKHIIEVYAFENILRV